MFYSYIVLSLYYFCGISYFVYKDYNYAKINKKNKILIIDQTELFDKLINN